MPRSGKPEKVWCLTCHKEYVSFMNSDEMFCSKECEETAVNSPTVAPAEIGPPAYDERREIADSQGH